MQAPASFSAWLVTPCPGRGFISTRTGFAYARRLRGTRTLLTTCSRTFEVMQEAAAAIREWAHKCRPIKRPVSLISPDYVRPQESRRDSGRYLQKPSRQSLSIGLRRRRLVRTSVDWRCHSLSSRRALLTIREDVAVGWEALDQWGDDVARIEPLTGGVGVNEVWTLTYRGKPSCCDTSTVKE